MQEALEDAQGGNGPLSLLEDATLVVGVRQHNRIRQANAWLRRLLRKEELDILARLVLFSCVTGWPGCTAQVPEVSSLITNA